MNRYKQAHMQVLTEDTTTVDGHEFKKGERVVSGAKCPKCGAFYAATRSLSACNRCGWRQKRLKPWELKRKQKRLSREKAEKEQEQKSVQQK